MYWSIYAWKYICRSSVLFFWFIPGSAWGRLPALCSWNHVVPAVESGFPHEKHELLCTELSLRPHMYLLQSLCDFKILKVYKIMIRKKKK